MLFCCADNEPSVARPQPSKKAKTILGRLGICGEVFYFPAFRARKSYRTYGGRDSRPSASQPLRAGLTSGAPTVLGLEVFLAWFPGPIRPATTSALRPGSRAAVSEEDGSGMHGALRKREHARFFDLFAGWDAASLAVGGRAAWSISVLLTVDPLVQGIEQEVTAKIAKRQKHRNGHRTSPDGLMRITSADKRSLGF
jgi:hypothetical protein